MPNRRRAGLIVLSFSILFSGFQPAHAARWEPLPLWGGQVVLAAAPGTPSVVYAATPAHGLYRSTNGGVSWQFVEYGPNRFELRLLWVDPHDERRLYAAAYDPADNYRGFFRSADGGRHWQPSGLGDVFVLGLAFDPRTPGRLYATTSDGLFRSQNRGRSWSRIAFAGQRVEAVAVAPADPQVVLVAVLNDSLAAYRSADGGRSFVQVLDQTPPQGFVFDPSRPGRVYAFTFGTVFRSDDLGASWTAGAPLGARSLAVTRSGILLSGSYEEGIRRSFDGGVTWQPGPDEAALRPRDNIGSLVVLGNGVLAGGDRGIWRGTDRGLGWRAASDGVRAQWIAPLAVAAGPEPTLWVVARAGLFLSSDGGQTFRARTAALTGSALLESLAVHPTQPETAYAFGCCVAEGRGLLRTDDGGKHWRLLPYDGVTRDVLWVEVDPSDSEVVYAGGAMEPHASACTFNRSIDGGRTWRCIPPPGTYGFQDLAFDPRDSRVFYGLFGRGVLYRTEDRGAHWTRLPTRGSAQGIDRIEIDPEQPDRLYAFSYDSLVLRSDNAGRTWRSLGAALPTGYVRDLVVDPARPGRLYVAIEVPEIGEVGKSMAHVFRSDDAGDHWQEISAGLRPGDVVVDLAVDPRGADVLYAGTAGQGLYRLDVEE